MTGKIHDPRPARGRQGGTEERRAPAPGGAVLPEAEAQRVLLVGSACGRQDLRARILRDHGIEVDVVKDVGEARRLWRPGVYDLVLIDVPKHWPGEVHQWREEIREAGTKERIAFLTGPPEYLSFDWPDCEMGENGSPWDETVRRISSVLALSRRATLVP